jgi:tetratricopeptide (TPR) repeat protein
MSIVSQLGNSRLYGRHKEALDKLSAGLPKDALSILVDLVQADPTNGYLCIDMGTVLMRVGMYDKAVIVARQAIELDSTNTEAFLLLASALTAKGDFKGANVALLRTIDLLRNPYRNEEALLKENALRPLVLGKEHALFIDFTMDGTLGDLSIKSVTLDRKATYVFKMVVSGNVELSPDVGYGQAESGEIEKNRILPCLPPELGNVVKIFPTDKFAYTIFKKIG